MKASFHNSHTTSDYTQLTTDWGRCCCFVLEGGELFCLICCLFFPYCWLHFENTFTDIVYCYVSRCPCAVLQVYSSSTDGTVRLWDFTDGILIKVGGQALLFLSSVFCYCGSPNSCSNTHVPILSVVCKSEMKDSDSRPERDSFDLSGPQIYLNIK